MSAPPLIFNLKKLIMRTIEIQIEGRKLPMRVTMGAMKDFKKLTGKETREMDMESPVEMATFIYCCICSACRKDGKAFETGLDDFLDSVDVETISQWGTELSEASDAAQPQDAARPDGSKTAGRKAGKRLKDYRLTESE